MSKRKPKKKGPVNNIVVVADTHIGSQLGLCCPSGLLDDGGCYQASPLQLKVWDWWNEFWNNFVPEATQGEPFAVVLNGDAMDGRHHNSTTQVSENLADQKKLAVRILGPVVEACQGRYYHIRGTEAHSGAAGENEEQLAESLGALPDSTGRFARPELWARIGGGGNKHPDALIHLLHHIGTTSSMAYESSAVLKEMEQMYVEAATWEHRPPDVVVRAHRHRHIEVRKRKSRDMYMTGFTVAAWQLKTPFVFKTAGGRITQPQIGGSVIRSGENDVYARHWVKDIQRTPPEVMTL